MIFNIMDGIRHQKLERAHPAEAGQRRLVVVVIIVFLIIVVVVVVVVPVVPVVVVVVIPIFAVGLEPVLRLERVRRLEERVDEALAGSRSAPRPTRRGAASSS